MGNKYLYRCYYIHSQDLLLFIVCWIQLDDQILPESSRRNVERSYIHLSLCDESHFSNICTLQYVRIEFIEIN